MILEHAVLSIVSGRESEFEESMRRALPVIERAPGCHGATVRQQVENESTYLLLVTWDSVEAHMAFRASDDFAQWKSLTHSFYDPFPTVTHFREPFPRATDQVVGDEELSLWPVRGPRDNKWSHAVHVVAGSPAMPGAAHLVCDGALAGGASMVRLTSRGNLPGGALPVEVVSTDHIDDRCGVVVVGPGLGTGASDWLATVLASAAVPVVVDADALHPSVVALRPDRDTWVLTPHDGEMERLDPDGGDDRVARVKAYAARTGCVTLLKGPETIVAAPDGRLRVVISGTPALATAGTGDVLAGLIGAGIAGGLDPFTAAWLGAHVHGLAGQRLPHRGGASLLAACVREVLSR